jgi:hypothetical protein
MKNSKDTIGNRSRDLPACSAVPQPLHIHTHTHTHTHTLWTKHNYFWIKRSGSYIQVKVSRNRPKVPDGGRGIALLFLDPSSRRGWVVSTTPRQLYHRERPGTQCTEGGVGPRDGLDVYEKLRLHRDSIPGPSSP